MLIDSHCHLDMLDLTPYQGNLADLLAAARADGVSFFLSVGTNLQQSKKILTYAETFPNVKVSVGIHPEEDLHQELNFDELLNLAHKKEVVAIGEIGLDYHWLKVEEDKPLMQKLFHEQICIAKKVKKPVIIHSRQAGDDVLKILMEEKANNYGGVLHCFSDDWSMAKKVLDLGFYLGITGIVTFKNAEVLREVVKKAPLDRLLVETDAPFLAPVPFRGKPNEPKYLPFIAAEIARIKNTSIEIIAEETSSNFLKLFSLEKEISI